MPFPPSLIAAALAGLCVFLHCRRRLKFAPSTLLLQPRDAVMCPPTCCACGAHAVPAVPAGQGVPQGLPAAAGGDHQPPKRPRHTHQTGGQGTWLGTPPRPFAAAAGARWRGGVGGCCTHPGQQQQGQRRGSSRGWQREGRTLPSASSTPVLPRNPSLPAASLCRLLAPGTLQVRVFGPRSDPFKALGHEVTFTSPQFGMYSTAR